MHFEKHITIDNEKENIMVSISDMDAKFVDEELQMTYNFFVSDLTTKELIDNNSKNDVVQQMLQSFSNSLMEDLLDKIEKGEITNDEVATEL